MDTPFRSVTSYRTHLPFLQTTSTNNIYCLVWTQQFNYTLCKIHLWVTWVIFRLDCYPQQITYTYRLLLVAIYYYYNRYYQLLSITIRDYSVPVENGAEVNCGGPPCDGQVASNDIITIVNTGNTRNGMTVVSNLGSKFYFGCTTPAFQWIAQLSVPENI